MKAGQICLFSLSCLFCALGCDNAETKPSLTVVHGTVTYLERPIAGGSIVFIPDEERGTTGKPVHADIQADGTYSLRLGERAGISPGKYRVTVASSTRQSRFGASQPPERYSDPVTSGLACKVEPVGDHTINFHLQ
ncbi:hypothetical protein BH10PLA2_BH10PLA2_37970 [soil metagenome]